MNAIKVIYLSKFLFYTYLDGAYTENTTFFIESNINPKLKHSISKLKRT